jgi:hypothetical protein
VPRAIRLNAQGEVAPTGWDSVQPLVLAGTIVPPLVEGPLAVPLEVPLGAEVPLVEAPLVEVPLVDVPLVELPLVDASLGGVVNEQ